MIQHKKSIISIAPMMDWTDRHYRYFMRLITKQTLLYTEMITANAIIHGDKERLLGYHALEHPLALQVGGSDPRQLAECVKIAEDYDYDEINLNVGCPSDRVQNGRFGACLLKEPELVAECIAAMQKVTTIPVTVKTRLGVDHLDSYEHLSHFIKIVTDTGCSTFILHARKAWLKGLSPKENREIPPLRYEVVYQIKQDFPQLNIMINGGIKTIEQMQKHLEFVNGVMLGREAYHNPYLFAVVDKLFYGEDTAPLSRLEVMEQYIPYILEELKKGIRLTQLIRPILGLFHGMPGAHVWRRYLSENTRSYKTDVQYVREALQQMMLLSQRASIKSFY